MQGTCLLLQQKRPRVSHSFDSLCEDAGSWASCGQTPTQDIPKECCVRGGLSGAASDLLTWLGLLPEFSHCQCLGQKPYHCSASWEGLVTCDPSSPWRPLWAAWAHGWATSPSWLVQAWVWPALTRRTSAGLSLALGMVFVFSGTLLSSGDWINLSSFWLKLPGNSRFLLFCWGGNKGLVVKATLSLGISAYCVGWA